MTIRLVIAGQGTVGREIAEDMAALSLTPDIVVAPASGGGLIAGGRKPRSRRRYPKDDPDVRRTGRLSTITRARCAPENAASLHPCRGPAPSADALMASIPGELTFAINSGCSRKASPPSDAESRDGASGLAFSGTENWWFEPGGA